MMILPRSRRYITPLTWCGLALGIAIVLWGASYKMEQYPAHGFAFRVMPPAKLLTEKERPPRQGILNAVAPAALASSRISHSPALSITARNSAAFDPPPGILLPAARAGHILKAQFTYFSFRPPPSPLHS